MSMTRNLLGLALVAVAGTAVSADPVTHDATTNAFKAQVDGFRTAQAVGIKTNTTREGAVAFYDIKTCPECKWTYNYGWVDPECFDNGDSNPGCTGYVYILPLNTDDPGGAYGFGTAPEFDDGGGNVWITDIVYDDYLGDETVFGDTGTTKPMVAFNGNAWTYNAWGSGQDKTYVCQYLWISDDGATFYGGWVWELPALNGENWGYSLTAGTLDDPQDPGDVFEVPYAGILCFDYANETLEGFSDAGAWQFFAGGDIADPAMPYPTDLYAVGYNDELLWAFGGIDDPNVDPDFDGDPELSYLDIYGTGYLINWAFVHDTIPSELSHATPSYMGISGSSCDGDINGDGMTSQADLGILLAAYNTCPGDPGYNAAANLDDTDGTGCIGQADLGVLLADFGCGQP